MRVLICGSRGWDGSDELIRRRIVALPDGTVIVHGGAKGADRTADRLARRVARERGFTFEVFRPDYAQHGQHAPLVRNREMVATKPDLVLAFWDGKSTGTAFTLDIAWKAGIPIEVIRAAHIQKESKGSTTSP